MILPISVYIVSFAGWENLPVSDAALVTSTSSLMCCKMSTCFKSS
jgi:hypothetical protein